MIKNSEVKKLFFVNILMFLIAILLCIIFAIKSFELYKLDLIKSNANLVGNLVINHPELEVEIINNLMQQKDINSEYGLQILNKYGLDDSEYLDYLSHNNDLKNKIILYNIIFTVFIVVNFFVIYYIFLKKQYKTIKDIDKYMNNILNNNYSLDIVDYKEGDLSNLKNDIYKMTIKLKEQNELVIKDKKNLAETLDDISHQIRTPLTSMYVINDILNDNKLDKKSQKEFLNKNRNQLERIEWLVTTLLKMSRLESGTVVLKNEKININELISKSVEPIKILAELKNIQIEIKNTCDCCYLDFNWTVEALINVLKNACEHTHNNGKILIEVLDNPLYLNIKICDNGVGISEEDQKHIFDRFYKGKHNKDSIGIGLNMSRKIINLQNGSIECNSQINVGTIFDIKFYKRDI